VRETTDCQCCSLAAKSTAGATSLGDRVPLAPSFDWVRALSGFHLETLRNLEDEGGIPPVLCQMEALDHFGPVCNPLPLAGGHLVTMVGTRRVEYNTAPRQNMMPAFSNMSAIAASAVIPMQPGNNIDFTFTVRCSSRVGLAASKSIFRFICRERRGDGGGGMGDGWTGVHRG